VKKHLAIDNCCDQLRAILKLKRLLHLRNIEEDKESFPEVRSIFCTARPRKKGQKKIDARPEFLVDFVNPVAFLTFLQAWFTCFAPF